MGSVWLKSGLDLFAVPPQQANASPSYHLRPAGVWAILGALLKVVSGQGELKEGSVEHLRPVGGGDMKLCREMKMIPPTTRRYSGKTDAAINEHIHRQIAM